MKKMIIKIAIVLTAIVTIGTTVAWYGASSQKEATPFQVAALSRGDVLETITATGTVEPEEVIDVGAQVAGQILSFGQDTHGQLVDYGSHVAAGTVLARIDDSLYKAEAANAQAQVQAGKAGQLRAEADLQQFKAKFNQAERDWQRAQKLGPSEALSQVSYDAYRSAYESAKANLAVGEAAILQAKAALAQAEASLTRAQRNLSYCTIISPVDGVIIDRRVNIGQTVVASLNAPSLFLIAKDLTRMQVWVAVNEADVGKIRAGQPITFTVDAFPGQTFRGEVGKVRLNASMTQNVVTYTVEIKTDNASGQLLPYLTANVQFEIQHVSDVLRVPNSALRWKPRPDQIAPEYRKKELQTVAAKMPKIREKAMTGAASAAQPAEEISHWIWTPEGGAYVRPVEVRTGVSDGSVTQVAGDGLDAGLAVVTGLQDLSAGSNDTQNPFTPQFLRRNRSQASR